MMASAIKSNSPRQFTATYSLLCGEARGGRGGGRGEETGRGVCLSVLPEEKFDKGST